MPERDSARITSIEAIQKRIQIFDEQLSEATEAARTLARIRGDASELMERAAELHEMLRRSLAESEGHREALESIRDEWSGLKADYKAAEERLIQAHKSLLASYGEKFQQIEQTASKTEKRVLEARDSVIAETKALKEFVVATKMELTSEIRKDFRIELESLKSNVQQVMNGVQQTLNEGVSQRKEAYEGAIKDLNVRLVNANESMREKVSAAVKKVEELARESAARNAQAIVRSEAKVQEVVTSTKKALTRDVGEHKAAFDRQVTEFLGRQNVLVQNLTQQVDSFQHGVATLKEDVAVMKRDLGTIKQDIVSVQSEGGLVKADIARIRANEMPALLQRVDRMEGKVGAEMKKLETRLVAVTNKVNEVVGKLGKGLKGIIFGIKE
ncbi:MAG: hypothetical protein NFCOHLIN_02965 [Gammaproteobacteria bacterium]|nr:hypothetical protein [Gammaproteobacteria bacterium]